LRSAFTRPASAWLGLIDNINRPFGSGVFDAALTGEEWKGRVLATNTMARMRLNTVWWGTGNNAGIPWTVETISSC
jgi:hypothetical protein